MFILTFSLVFNFVFFLPNNLINARDISLHLASLYHFTTISSLSPSLSLSLHLSTHFLLSLLLSLPLSLPFFLCLHLIAPLLAPSETNAVRCCGHARDEQGTDLNATRHKRVHRDGCVLRGRPSLISLFKWRPRYRRRIVEYRSSSYFFFLF